MRQGITEWEGPIDKEKPLCEDDTHWAPRVRSWPDSDLGEFSIRYKEVCPLYRIVTGSTFTKKKQKHKNKAIYLINMNS